MESVATVVSIRATNMTASNRTETIFADFIAESKSSTSNLKLRLDKLLNRRLKFLQIDFTFPFIPKFNGLFTAVNWYVYLIVIIQLKYHQGATTADCVSKVPIAGVRPTVSPVFKISTIFVNTRGGEIDFIAHNFNKGNIFCGRFRNNKKRVENQRENQRILFQISL